MRSLQKKKTMRRYLFLIPFLMMLGCEQVDHDGELAPENDSSVPMEEVARLLSALDIGPEQIGEVRDAVASSAGNGYDEEYMMKDLLSAPGTGVGEASWTKGMKSYSRPLRDMISEYVSSGTKAGETLPSMRKFGSAGEYLKAVAASGLQIYWPFSENYDGTSAPVITFDPGDGSESNVGYRISRDSKGVKSVEEVVVDESYAEKHPVWVVNRNDDSGYSSLAVLRREDPEWGTVGGGIEVKGGDTRLRTLILKDFTMYRNYDTWFAGGSEFFVKMGSLDDFTASTEAELLIYKPLITDFMIAVKRHQKGEPVPFNAVLISNWTSQLENCAFMVTEDDGGTRTSWKTEAEVKVNSKTYGILLNIPYNSRDDIVWRGHLSSPFIEKYSGLSSRFGDIGLTLEIVER